MNNKVYLFTHQEFLVLAAAAGIKKMYGFEINSEQPKPEDAVQILHRLTKDGYLIVKDDYFCITGHVQEIFLQIANTDTIFDIHKKSGKTCILYIGEKIVQISQASRREGMLEIQEIPLEGLLSFLEDEGWLPSEKKKIQEEAL